MAPAALVLALTGLAGAAPKVPKELEDVELADGVIDVKVERKVQVLGGRKVTVFVQRYALSKYEERRELVVLDRDTKERLFATQIWDQEPSWKDFDGDGERELRLTGAGQAMRVFQIRYGNLVEVGVDAAACGRAEADTVGFGDEDSPVLRDDAVARFLHDVDYSASDRILRCDFVDALAAWPAHVWMGSQFAAAWPEKGVTFTMAPLALDCPASDWMARHGYVEKAVRVGTYITSEKRLALLRIDESGVAVNLPFDRAVVWSQPWILDERLYVLGESELQPGVHDWFVIDAVTETTLASGRLAKGQSAALQVGTAGSGVFELVTIGSESKSLWRKVALSWR